MILYINIFFYTVNNYSILPEYSNPINYDNFIIDNSV